MRGAVEVRAGTGRHGRGKLGGGELGNDVAVDADGVEVVGSKVGGEWRGHLCLGAVWGEIIRGDDDARGL